MQKAVDELPFSSTFQS